MVIERKIAISLKNVSKCFKRYEHPGDRLKELLFPGKSRAQEFWALRDINLEVAKGETLGIVGRNGSGKSTLLQIIVGTLTTNSGEVKVNGRISALLELGSGFNPEFTGRQNVFFNGRLLGLKQEEIAAKFDEIAAFADIGDFIEQPVKTYSSGMFVRLAFAVAIHVDPEILVVDEALSVGDGVFVHRCMARIKSFQDSGGTILFVSHDMGAVNRLCSRCIWINQSQIVEQGSPSEVSKSYQSWIYEQINDNYRKNSSKAEQEPVLEQQKEQKNQTNNSQNIIVVEDKAQEQNAINTFTNQKYLNFNRVTRFGTGRSEIIDFKILDKSGKNTSFVLPEQIFSIWVTVKCHDFVKNPIIGITIYDRLRTTITAWNTTQYQHELPSLNKGETIIIKFTVNWPHIKNDNYLLEPAMADGSQENHEMLDWLQSAFSLQSGVTSLTFGLMALKDISISHNVIRAAKLTHQVLESA